MQSERSKRWNKYSFEQGYGSKVWRFMLANPGGVSIAEIDAEFSFVNKNTLRNILLRLVERGFATRVKLKKYEYHYTGIDALDPDETPPVFNAMRNLQAMQDAARQQLMK